MAAPGREPWRERNATPAAVPPPLEASRSRSPDRRKQRRNAVPIVTVQQSPRDIELKRRLVAGINEAFVDAYGIAPENVQVFIHEVDHDNWAKAGILASDR
jgi:4-oxalocrotonate tautomerase